MSASSAQPSTTASAASRGGVLAAAVALPAALLNATASGLAGENHTAPAINVEASALSAEEQQVQELHTKWTQKVLN